MDADPCHRDSPFSIWGQEPGVKPLRVAIMPATVALVLLVAFLPRRRALPQIAALVAAILIAVQLTAEHWFYLYIVWFFQMALLSLLNRGALSQARPQLNTGRRGAEAQRGSVQGSFGFG